jgi:hypothetical protein
MSVDAEYPPELDRWVERLEERERMLSRARAHQDSGGTGRPLRVTDFVLMSLSSGVIGNVGYDLIKAALRAWRRPKVRLPERARDMRDAVLIAVLATQARCAQVDLPSPVLDDLEVTECERQPDRWRIELRKVDRTVYLHGGRPWPDGVALAATVVIPDGPVHGRMIDVTVVAKRDVDVAERAHFQRIQAIVDEPRPPERDA